MASSIDPDVLWQVFKNYHTAGHRKLALDLAREVERVLPSMPLEGVKELLAEAPHKTQHGLWELWTEQADLSGLSLEYMTKQTRGLSPSVLVVVWCAWVKQADLSQYNREDFSSVARKWPLKVNKAVSEVAFERWPHLRIALIRTINQLTGRR